MSLPHLHELDSDGAIREAEEAVAGDTRASFFKKAAIGGGTVVGGGAFLGMLPELAMARPSKRQDIQILNFALTLEYLEAAFYKEAVDGGALSGPVLDLASLLNTDEQTHVSALRKTIRSLGGKPVKMPRFDFRNTTSEQGRFLQTSFTLENTGVRAYLGQAPRLKSRALLAVAGSIATVESRHASAIATQLNRTPFKGKFSIAPSGSFDRASSMKTILREVKATGFIKGS